MASAIATPFVAPERRSPVWTAAHLNATITSAAPSNPSVPSATCASGRWRQMLGWLEDAGLLVVLTLAFPVVILIVGTPVAFVGWLLLEIVRRSI